MKNKKCETTHEEKKIWKELKKYGITNEKELDLAIKNMPRINIGCFVNQIQN